MPSQSRSRSGGTPSLKSPPLQPRPTPQGRYKDTPHWPRYPQETQCRTRRRIRPANLTRIDGERRQVSWCSLNVSRLTVAAVTPSMAFSVLRIRAAQEGHVNPSTGIVTVSSGRVAEAADGFSASQKMNKGPKMIMSIIEAVMMCFFNASPQEQSRRAPHLGRPPVKNHVRGQPPALMPRGPRTRPFRWPP